jgi:hypothetical protein
LPFSRVAVSLKRCNWHYAYEYIITSNNSSRNRFCRCDFILENTKCELWHFVNCSREWSRFIALNLLVFYNIAMFQVS